MSSSNGERPPAPDPGGNGADPPDGTARSLHGLPLTDDILARCLLVAVGIARGKPVRGVWGVNVEDRAMDLVQEAVRRVLKASSASVRTAGLLKALRGAMQSIAYNAGMSPENRRVRFLPDGDDDDGGLWEPPRRPEGEPDVDADARDAYLLHVAQQLPEVPAAIRVASYFLSATDYGSLPGRLSNKGNLPRPLNVRREFYEALVAEIKAWEVSTGCHSDSPLSWSDVESAIDALKQLGHQDEPTTPHAAMLCAVVAHRATQLPGED